MYIILSRDFRTTHQYIPLQLGDGMVIGTSLDHITTLPCIKDWLFKMNLENLSYINAC